MNAAMSWVLFGSIGAFGASLALAQAPSYPAKAVRVIVPYNAGGQSDTLARAVGQKLTERWGQPIIVENRAGAGGNIGAEYVARAAPDGYTLLTAEGAVFTVNPSLYKNLSWDPIKDFAPITRLNFYASALVVHPSVPARNVGEFIALARSKPGALNYATFGIGSGGHTAMEAFKLLQNIDLVAVHYKGSAPAVVDLTAGRLATAFFSIASAAPLVKAGKWRALGYAYPTRSPIFPDVPTFAEQGIPGFEVTSWFCLMAPAGTPRAIIGRIQQEVARVIKEPVFEEQWFTSKGMEAAGESPEELAALIRAEIPYWAKVIKAAGMTLE
ncbi:MAG: Bug family tripartite tricarboxylate transporter substrate binding protein [Burkholderiales bacterium]